MSSSSSRPPAEALARQACLPACLCRDEAPVARVIGVNVSARTADVELEGELSTVALDLIEDVKEGDLILTHLGFAIGRVNLPETEP